MNILPIPALDGGHVLFLLFEVITGKKAKRQVS
jgi:regulator of sigma E protease